jgi:hypothetical protein
VRFVTDDGETAAVPLDAQLLDGAQARERRTDDDDVLQRGQPATPRW